MFCGHNYCPAFSDFCGGVQRARTFAFLRALRRRGSRLAEWLAGRARGSNRLFVRALLAAFSVCVLRAYDAPYFCWVLPHCFCIGRGAYVGQFGITEAPPSGAGSVTSVGFSVNRVKHCTAPSGWRVLPHCFCIGRGAYVGRFAMTETSPPRAGSATPVVPVVRSLRACAAPSGGRVLLHCFCVGRGACAGQITSRKPLLPGRKAPRLLASR